MKVNDALMAMMSSSTIPAAQTLDWQISEQQTDPLIDQDGEIAIYVGLFVIIIAIAVVIRTLSQRVEHAVFTALGLSLLLIAFFFLMTR